jgi:hypothetical protein
MMSGQWRKKPRWAAGASGPSQPWGNKSVTPSARYFTRDAEFNSWETSFSR